MYAVIPYLDIYAVILSPKFTIKKILGGGGLQRLFSLTKAGVILLLEFSVFFLIRYEGLLIQASEWHRAPITAWLHVQWSCGKSSRHSP